MRWEWARRGFFPLERLFCPLIPRFVILSAVFWTVLPQQEAAPFGLSCSSQFATIR